MRVSWDEHMRGKEGKTEAAKQYVGSVGDIVQIRPTIIRFNSPTILIVIGIGVRFYLVLVL